MELSNLSKDQKDLLDALKKAVVAIDEENATDIAQKIITSGIDPNLALKYSIAEGAVDVGAKFDTGEYFLPHLVMVGDLMEAVGKILEKNMPTEQIARKKIIVIGTVEGDMHSVGKNLVATMLRSGGFEIHDTGVDVSSTAIIQKAKEVNADLIALSSLLTTTMPYQKEVVDDLISMGIRDQFKIIIGGGPVTKEYAEKIGADAYGKDAVEALEVVKKLF